LLQKNQDEGNFVFFVELLDGGLLDLFEVDMHILVAIENVGSLVQKIVQELSHQESCSLVLLSRHVHLGLEVNIVVLKKLVLSLSALQFLLDFFQLVLQEIDEIFVGLVLLGVSAHIALISSRMATTYSYNSRSSTIALSFLCFKLLDLLFKPLDDFLAEMGPLSQLFLDFLVDLDVSLERVDLALHFVVPEKQVFCLFALVLKFSCQLLVLQNRQGCCGLQLFVVKGKQVGLSFFDLTKHFFSQVFSYLDLLSFAVVDVGHPVFLFLLESCSKRNKFLFHLVLLLLELCNLLLLTLVLNNNAFFLVEF
jgi:hypothetical protein